MAFPHYPEINYQDNDEFDVQLHHLISLLRPDLRFLEIRSGLAHGSEHELGDRLYRWIGAWMNANDMAPSIHPGFDENQAACLLAFGDLERLSGAYEWDNQRDDRLRLLARVQLKIAPVQDEIRLRFEIRN
jgi:hypothetical protein